MHKIQWKKGSSGVALSISMLGFSMLFVALMHFVTLYMGFQHIETALQAVQRDIVVCESLEDANEVAQKRTDEILGNSSIISDPQAKVELVGIAGDDAGTEKWDKGQFAVLSIEADVHGLFSIGKNMHSLDYIFMIETKD